MEERNLNKTVMFWSEPKKNEKYLPFLDNQKSFGQTASEPEKLSHDDKKLFISCA